MTSTIDPGTTFLFDVGNVILHFDFIHFARAIEPHCDHSAEQLLDMIEHPKEELESSMNHTETFLKLATELTGYRGPREEFIRAWQEIFELNQPIADWIEALDEAGHPLFLLSNTNELHVDHFMNAYPVFSRFQGWVFSHEAGMAKPDPDIFQHTIEKLSLTPERTIYLDDLAANAAAASAAGLRAVCYTGQSPAAIIDEAYAG